MEIGIDSFASAMYGSYVLSSVAAIEQLFTFQMDNAGLRYAQFMDAISLIGSGVIPLIKNSK